MYLGTHYQARGLFYAVFWEFSLGFASKPVTHLELIWGKMEGCVGSLCSVRGHSAAPRCVLRKLGLFHSVAVALLSGIRRHVSISELLFCFAPFVCSFISAHCLPQFFPLNSQTKCLLSEHLRGDMRPAWPRDTEAQPTPWQRGRLAVDPKPHRTLGKRVGRTHLLSKDVWKCLEVIDHLLGPVPRPPVP